VNEGSGTWRVVTRRRVAASVVGAVLLLFLVDFTHGPFFSFSTRMVPPQPYGDKIMGGVEGPVKHTEADTNTVGIASGILGLASLPVVITPETTISVNGKFGGFGDLRRGLHVRVAYEVRGDQFVAARVDVLDQWWSSADAAIPIVRDDDGVVGEEAATEAASPPQPDVAAPAPPTAGLPATRAPSSPAVRTTPWRPVAAPRGNAKESTSPSAAPRSLEGAARPPAGTSAARSRQAPAPNAAQSEDGGAVIDWLFRESAGATKSAP
jgi:hypothetical protein